MVFHIHHIIVWYITAIHHILLRLCIVFIPLLRNQRRKIHVAFQENWDLVPNLPQQSRHRLMQVLRRTAGDSDRSQMASATPKLCVFHRENGGTPGMVPISSLILKEIWPSHLHKNSSNIAIAAHGLKLLKYLKQQWTDPTTTSFKRYESLITPNFLFVLEVTGIFISFRGANLGPRQFSTHRPFPNPPASLVTEPNRTLAGKRESLVMRMSGAPGWYRYPMVMKTLRELAQTAQLDSFFFSVSDIKYG